MRPLRICFVAPAAYPVLAADRSIPFVGGAEVQQAFLAPELARRGHDVSMLSMDFGQREGDVVKGVRLLKMCAPTAGIPVLRFVHPRLTSLWCAMHRADADVYYQRAAGAGIGFVAHFARTHGRRAVYASASDRDFDPALPRIRFGRDKFLFRYGVRTVNQVVVQTERQVQLCRQAFGRDAALVRSCYRLEGNPAHFDGPIVWVGTIQPVKRPELFLDLAQRLPQYKFRLVGGATAGAAQFEALQQRANALGNVEMTGFVPYADIDVKFDGASLLINTSAAEGFPNTFLQAWSRGIPTVSFFDAGARSNGANVGVTVPDLDAMERAVLGLKSDPEHWSQHGARAAEHCRRSHSVASAVDEYERIFEGIGLVAKPAQT